MKKLYSFLMLALVLALGSASALAQSITVSPSEINAGVEGYDNTLTVIYDGYDVSNYDPNIKFYDADGITPVESGAYSWLSAYFMRVSYTVDSVLILELPARPISGWCWKTPATTTTRWLIPTSSPSARLRTTAQHPTTLP